MPASFKRVDPEDLWCKSCRNFRPPAASPNYQPPLADDGPVCSTPSELNLDGRRVVVVQRIGGVVRISTARRIKRSETDSLILGGTVLLPVENLREICREVMAASEGGD